jgi:hypothetical protein
MVTVVVLGISGRLAASDELAPPVRLEAAGQVIDTEIGHAAPFVTDFDGDGVQDLLVGDDAQQKPDRAEATPEEAAEHERIRKELEPLGKRFGELIQRMHGDSRPRTKEDQNKLGEEMSRISTQMATLRRKLPREYESHGWVWLFLRK